MNHNTQDLPTVSQADALRLTIASGLITMAVRDSEADGVTVDEMGDSVIAWLAAMAAELFFDHPELLHVYAVPVYGKSEKAESHAN